MTRNESLSLIRSYYDRKTGLIPAGTGLVWYMGQDQLHPPMINNEKFWTSPEGWKEGAEQTVENLLTLIGTAKNENILDIGSGVGGPGRLACKEFGLKVIELNISRTQLKTNKSLSGGLFNRKYRQTNYLQGDGQQLPLSRESIDNAMSINMFYHLEKPSWIANELYRTLKPGGKVGIDDWFLTDMTTRDTLEKLRYEWSSPTGFHKYTDIINIFKKAGFSVEKEVDMTQSGINFINEKFFGSTFDRNIKPIILKNFARIYGSLDYNPLPEHAEQAANQLKNAVLLMGDLYRNGQASYNQIVFVK